MPWYWTDDLARNLIAAGKVDEAKVAGWIATPVAVRRASESVEEVAGSMLEEDGDGSERRLAVAA